jgi:4-hydroxy-tetrahydrodipicolinate synthase
MASSLGTILTAMVTPFDGSLRVDEDATVALMNHLVTHGSDGLVICGTTGEATTLTDEEHLRVIELAVQERPAGVSIIAGTGSNDTRHAVELTERATELGADAMLSVTPYYNRPNRRGIVRHFEEVAKATDRPIVLYNIPSRTGTDLPVDLLAELAQIDHVQAVKQANNASLQLVDGLDVYAGNDDILRDPGGEPHRRRADATNGRSAGASGGDRRLAAGRVRGPCGYEQPNPGQSRAQPAWPPGGGPAATDGRG